MEQPSKHEDVLNRLKAVIAAALIGAKVGRNMAKPAREEPGGVANVKDGDPGEPEIDLGPLAYKFSRLAEVDVFGYAPTPPATNESVSDGMCKTIGDAIAADPTLGGVCDWAEAQAAYDMEFDEAEGVPALPFKRLPVLLMYVCDTPTG